MDFLKWNPRILFEDAILIIQICRTSTFTFSFTPYSFCFPGVILSAMSMSVEPPIFGEILLHFFPLILTSAKKRIKSLKSTSLFFIQVLFRKMTRSQAYMRLQPACRIKGSVLICTLEFCFTAREAAITLCMVTHAVLGGSSLFRTCPWMPPG